VWMPAIQVIRSRALVLFRHSERIPLPAGEIELIGENWRYCAKGSCLRNRRQPVECAG